MVPSTEELARLDVDIQTIARTERKPPTNAQIDTLIEGFEHILSKAGDTLTKAEVAVVVGATAGLRDASDDLNGTPHE